MAAASPTELELIKQFRPKVKDLHLNDDLNSDMELLRWIRAREHDLEAAEKMLRKHIQWREETMYDQIGNWEVPAELKSYIHDEFIGYDRENSPIVFSELGKWNFKKLFQESDSGVECFFNSRWKLIVRATELMRAKRTSDGVPVTQMAIIMNFDGFSIRQTTFQVLRAQSDVARLFEANFPEILKICVIYNVPWFFPKIFSFIKPFLSQKTFGKFHIVGKMSEDTTEFMKSLFPDNITSYICGLKNSSSNVL
ncbi:unnamed protein product [Allacma fusca]|uniref:CRAL-TRIO domain-containing protein n=1 Tax=Allacma fusca TaxID=39272 RepID=A0A8J2PRU5_9HEXA|nr:unnamed protein product [Allacma fusca]